MSNYYTKVTKMSTLLALPCIKLTVDTGIKLCLPIARMLPVDRVTKMVYNKGAIRMIARNVRIMRGRSKR